MTVPRLRQFSEAGPFVICISSNNIIGSPLSFIESVDISKKLNLANLTDQKKIWVT